MVKNKIFSISCLTLGMLIIYDIFLLYKYAFDLPFWDTWDLLPRGGWSHVFEFYNENMQFFYFIISEILYIVLDWNLQWFIFIDFAIYLGLIFLYNKILQQAQNIKVPYYPLFLCILLTPMLGYNWLWVLLVQTHTFILFFLLAIYSGFTKDDEKYSPYLFAICLFLSVISMNIPLAIGGLLAYVIKEAVNSKENGISKAIKKCLIALGILFLLGCLLMVVTNVEQFVAIKLSHSVFKMEYLYDLSFYLINGFGVFVFAPILNAKFCLFFMVVHFSILALVFFEQYKIKKLQSLWGIIFGILFCVCGVVALRGGEVYFYAFSYIRHNETLFMLIPATLLVLAVSKYQFARIYGMFLLFYMMIGVCADIKSQRFQFFGELFYKNGCMCINHYYNLKTISDWKCTMNFPIPVDERMHYAKNHNLSFYENILKCN